MSAAILLENLGAEIRARRRAVGMSQEKLALEAHIHPNLVGRIERGKANPTVITLNAVADVLECTVADLFVGAESGAD